MVTQHVVAARGVRHGLPVLVAQAQLIGALHFRQLCSPLLDEVAELLEGLLEGLGGVGRGQHLGGGAGVRHHGVRVSHSHRASDGASGACAVLVVEGHDSEQQSKAGAE